MTDKVVVLVTCGTEAESRRIARNLVERGLAACVTIGGAPVRSIFRWKGKVEQASEYLLIAKSTRRRLTALQRAVTRMHSYDVPEVIALPIAAGSRAYLDWLAGSVTEPAKNTGIKSGKARRAK